MRWFVLNHSRHRRPQKGTIGLKSKAIVEWGSFDTILLRLHKKLYGYRIHFIR